MTTKKCTKNCAARAKLLLGSVVNIDRGFCLHIQRGFRRDTYRIRIRTISDSFSCRREN